MPCLLVLLALLVPRGVVVALWLLTDRLEVLFDTWMWPVLGFLFLPTTLLWYVAVQHWFGGEWNVATIGGLVVALAIDTAPAAGG